MHARIFTVDVLYDVSISAETIKYPNLNFKARIIELLRKELNETFDMNNEKFDFECDEKKIKTEGKFKTLFCIYFD